MRRWFNLLPVIVENVDVLTLFNVDLVQNLVFKVYIKYLPMFLPLTNNHIIILIPNIIAMKNRYSASYDVNTYIIPIIILFYV